MKRSLRRHRKARLESLEQRRLLTSIADIAFWPGPTNDFVVRRDEAEPVQLWIQPDYQVPRSAALTVEITQAGSGSLQVIDQPDQQSFQFDYQPEPGFVGVDTFELAFTPDGPDAEPIIVDVAVNVVEPLLAVDDWFHVGVDSETTQLDVLRNDVRNATYIGSEPVFTLQSFTSDGNGTLEINEADGTFSYTPESGFSGVETIHYTTIDQDGYTAAGITQVRVSDENSARLWPEQLQQQLVQASVDQNRYRFGSTDNYGRFYGPIALGVPDSLATPDIAVEAPADGSVAGADVSGTNNQIAEVDESDRIKTDGDYLYVLSSAGQQPDFSWDFFPFIGLPFVDDGTAATKASTEDLLTIVDVRQPATPTIVSRQVFTDRVDSLDLSGDRLTVISQRSNQTVVTTLDVSDAANVQTVSTTVIDGTFRQARRVGESLYLFTNEYGNQLPALERISPATGDAKFFESGLEYLSRIQDSLVETVFSVQEVFDGDGNRVEVDSILIDPLTVGYAPRPRINIATFDTSRDVGGAIDWDVNLGGDKILVTQNSIFITETVYDSVFTLHDVLPVFAEIPQRPTVMTEVDRYELQDDGMVVESASGAVPGTLKNSFSLDEYDGMLRIATENSWRVASEELLGTSVYVMQQTDQSLDIIGGVTGLAPGERVYAVRFAAERAYVVTFLRVDPLFVIDLSQPTSPQEMGQLKVPGYSQYLHVISQDHVLGVGRDANEETGLYEGLTVSLFNVSDPANPTLQDRFLFEGGRSTYSPFAAGDPWQLRDHHAISYFADSGVLALPIYSEVVWWNEDVERDAPIFDQPEQSAVYTFQIDGETGITQLDTIDFDDRADRTMRIGEHLYSLSPAELKVTNLLEPDGVIASLLFHREGADDFVDTPVGESVMIDVIGNDGIDGNTQTEILAARLVSGEGEVEIIDGSRIQFRPGNRSLAPQTIRYSARTIEGTLIDALATVDPDLQWQNQIDRYDVNNDDAFTPQDILNVINKLSATGTQDTEELELAMGNADAEHFYYDVSGDGLVSPLDALLGINRIARLGRLRGAAVAEAETVAAAEAEAVDMVFASERDDEEEEILLPPTQLF